MAHSPEKKAAVVADLILGLGIREAAKKHKVGVETVSRWNGEMGQSGTPPCGADIVPSDEEYNRIVRARIERFNRAFEEFLHAGISLGQAHATLLQEREFLASLDSAKLEPMLESVDRKWLALLGKIGGSG